VPTPFVYIVGDVQTALTQPFDQLIALSLHDPRVVGTLKDQERGADVVEVGDRRALEQKLAVGLGVPYPVPHRAAPEGGNALHKGDEVRRAYQVDPRRPVFR